MENQSYLIIYLLSMALLVCVAAYVYRLRKKLDEMHGMMVGMTFGMVAGLVTATLYLIPTGDFLYGFIFGSIAGLLFGIPFGKLGGHLGTMEGVVAGPMGGMMGAMLGQMIRPFSIDVFIPFFIFIFLITVAGISYACNCGANSGKTGPAKPSDKFLISWTIAAVFMLVASIILPFSVPAGASGASIAGAAQSQIKKEAVVNGNYQEVDLEITSSKYVPEIITAKKGIPLKINIRAGENAGCIREIVFPDFNVDEIIPAGGSKVIEINPAKEGTFIFRCPMDMVRGTLIISE